MDTENVDPGPSTSHNGSENKPNSGGLYTIRSHQKQANKVDSGRQNSSPPKLAKTMTTSLQNRKFTSWRDKQTTPSNTTNRIPNQSRNNNFPFSAKRSNPNPSLRFPSAESRGNNYTSFVIGTKFLEQTLAKEPSEILIAFAQKKSEFNNFFNAPMNPEIIVLSVKILSKACETAFDTSKGEVLSSVCNSNFVVNLENYLTRLPLQHEMFRASNRSYYGDVDSFWRCIVQFLDTVLNLMPSTACEKFFVTVRAAEMNMSSAAISETTKQSFKKFQTKFMLCHEERMAKKEKAPRVEQTDYEEPPENFRNLSVYPNPHDILSNDKVYLRPNITRGAYHSVDHYLDVQFRLLREDFICPLRDGISDLFETNKKKRFSSVRIYPKTTFVAPHITTNIVGSLVDFRADKRLPDGTLRKVRNINWERSKRFMFGSLLCFTADKFQNIIFGTVADRDIKLLSKGYVIVKICDEYFAQENQMYGNEYFMVENEVYFEPYYHVLKALKTMNADNFPMENYLVNVQSDAIAPRYLEDDTIYECDDLPIIVKDVEQWPSAEQLNLNDSQYRAFRVALTNEFAIIQGPPGTGKTYLGLKVASVLLNNLNQKQMLVVCYTNHALDQFLEGLIPYTDQIVRVGNRSKNENLDKFNLSKKRGRFQHSFVHIKHDIETIVNTLQSKIKDLELLNSYEGIIDISSTDVFKQLVRSKSWIPTNSGTLFSNFAYWLLGFDHNNHVREGNFVSAHLPNFRNPDQAPLTDDLHDESDELHRIAEELEIPNEDIGRITSNLKYDISPNDLYKRLQVLNKDLTELESYLMEPRENEHLLYEALTLKRQQYGDISYVFDMFVRDLNNLSQKKLGNIRNVPDIVQKNGPNCNKEERWSIYSYCLAILKNRIMREMTKLNLDYRRLYKVFQEFKNMDDLDILKEARVIGMTTTSAARLQPVLKELKVPIVIIEEAAEVPESHIIVSLTMRCEHLILIGDHQQLKPSTSAYKLAKKYNLDVSLFERMLKNGMHCVRLDVQHRMRPEISSLITPTIYPNLENHASVLEFPHVKGVKKSLFFIKHNVFEDNTDDEDTVTRKNMHEAYFLIRLCRHLVLQGYDPEKITILTTYTGQMYLIRGEIKLYSILDKVKVTAVDNFQGEENDIILLSLVRSNSEANIGFLKTENRVCVALSRAKIGLYVIGNMDNLIASSEIWPKINESLEKQESVDTHLVLQCQLHPDKETRVSCAEDFNKAPEGGCDMLCRTLLKCAHYCNSICHISDRDHILYNCKEPCTRLCKREHPCRNLCFQACSKCLVIVSKELKCGHTHDMECGLEREKYKCRVVVQSVLPPCKHEVSKPCFCDPEKFPCTVPCENRLDCGHKCERNCHVQDDPDHVTYSCNKPCAKRYKGCTNDHPCEKLCFEDCPPCSIKVKKTRKDCSHYAQVACAEDIDASRCLQNCKRMMECGHHCLQKCWQECGNCRVNVNKVVPGCGHEIRLFCHEDAVGSKCYKKCERKLQCGHDCKKLCKDKCTEICQYLIKSDVLKSACGHFSYVPCHLADKPQSAFTGMEFLNDCKEDCTAVLRCGHKCRGKCSECYQGRIHMPCMEACGNVLVCQHSCKDACRQYCPPCKQPCNYRCVHSKCPKKCGEPCVRCKEPCNWRCKHKQCKKKCGDQCDRTPCDEPCLEQLECGHPCIGLCGEKCPKICRICNEEEVKTIFFGEEDEPEARFVMLEECSHVFEVTGLDKWFAANAEEIAPKQCPKCNRTINVTPRYANACKKAFWNIVQVKVKIFGNQREISIKRGRLNNKINLLLNRSMNICKASHTWKQMINTLKEKTQQFIKNRKQTLSAADIANLDIACDIMSKINDYYQNIKLPTNECKLFLDHSNVILNSFSKVGYRMSDQFLDDINRELSRLHWITELCKVQMTSEYKANKVIPDVKESFKECESSLMSVNKFTNVMAEGVKQKLDALLKIAKSSTVITPEEKKMIIKAMGFPKAGHWYTCPNKHIYSIGDCGGAMQTAQCPECKSPIGGSSHRLLDSNRVATEMDGATRPAFS